LIIHEDDYDDIWAYHGAPSCGWSHPDDGNYNDDSEGEEHTHDSETGTGKGKRTKNGKGKRKGKATNEGKLKGNGNEQGQGIVKQNPRWDDISRVAAMQFQMEMLEADSDTEG